MTRRASRARIRAAAFISVLCAAYSPRAARADDIDTLYARFRAGLPTGVSTPSAAAANGWLSALGADGTWPDIDLSLKEQVNWTPRQHLSRLASLAKAWTAPGHALAGDAAAAAKIGAALNAYLAADPISTNWWYNEIGAQNELGPFLYMWRAKLTAAQREGADSVMARSWRSKQRTGQNLVWISRITAWRAAFNRDTAMLGQASRAIAGTIGVTTGEGIQADFSFHQHGAQLYNGGYGNGYAADMAALAVDFAGTRYAFDDGATRILARYLLEGQRWMVRGGVMDHSVRGREITRAGSGSAASIGRAAANMAKAYPTLSVPLAAMADSIAGNRGSAVSGAKWFWRSEYLAHHGPGHSVSLRMASSRLQASELVNQEGLLSTYLADGATFLYRTGREYDGIFPVWNWSRIPGTTAADGPTPAMRNPAPGNGTFAGGADLRDHAVAAFAQDKLGVKARKAWFFLDRRMVALGAGISAAGDAPIRTTVNQCLLNGPITHAGGTLAPGAALPADARWILHDGVGYLLPAVAGTKASLKAGPASGNWKRINAYQSGTTVTENVFDLGLDHGIAPSAGRYAYTVLPGADAAALARESAEPEADILSHTQDLMAVRLRDPDVIAAAFFAPGSFEVSPGKSVSASRACVLILETESATNGPGIRLAASDPARGTADLVLTFGWKLGGKGAAWSEAEGKTTLTIRLPQGADSAGAAYRGDHGYSAGIADRARLGRRAAPTERLHTGKGFGWRFARPSGPEADARGRETAP